MDPPPLHPHRPGQKMGYLLWIITSPDVIQNGLKLYDQTNYKQTKFGRNRYVNVPKPTFK